MPNEGGMTPKGCRGDVTMMRRHRGRALDTTITSPRGVARSREGERRREKEREGERRREKEREGDRMREKEREGVG